MYTTLGVCRITYCNQCLNLFLKILMSTLAFHQGLELSFVNGALTCSSAALGFVLRTFDCNLAPSALVVAFSKIK